MPWASCESHLEVSEEEEEEEVLGHLQGCTRCFCTAVGMEEFGMEEFGIGRTPGLTEPLSSTPSSLQESSILGQAVAEPAPEPETVQPQQPRMVPHLIKAVERQG